MAKVDMHRRPEALQRQLAGLSPGYRRVVALDLATNCGVAWADFKVGQPLGATIIGGQLDLSIGQYDTAPLRLVRLKQFLAVLSPHIIGYENVRATPPIDNRRVSPAAILARAAPALELLGSLKSIMSLWAHENNVPAEGYSIGTIKKRATGKGNANKEQMIRAANAFFGTKLAVDDYQSTGADNIADALWVCQLTLEGNCDGIS